MTRCRLLKAFDLRWLLQLDGPPWAPDCGGTGVGRTESEGTGVGSGRGIDRGPGPTRESLGFSAISSRRILAFLPASRFLADRFPEKVCHRPHAAGEAGVGLESGSKS